MSSLRWCKPLKPNNRPLQNGTDLSGSSRGSGWVNKCDFSKGQWARRSPRAPDSLDLGTSEWMWGWRYQMRRSRLYYNRWKNYFESRGNLTTIRGCLVGSGDEAMRINEIFTVNKLKSQIIGGNQSETWLENRGCSDRNPIVSQKISENRFGDISEWQRAFLKYFRYTLLECSWILLPWQLQEIRQGMESEHISNS
jgi:hypothetical protein